MFSGRLIGAVRRNRKVYRFLYTKEKKFWWLPAYSGCHPCRMRCYYNIWHKNFIYTFLKQLPKRQCVLHFFWSILLIQITDHRSIQIYFQPFLRAIYKLLYLLLLYLFTAGSTTKVSLYFLRIFTFHTVTSPGISAVIPLFADKHVGIFFQMDMRLLKTGYCLKSDNWSAVFFPGSAGWMVQMLKNRTAWGNSMQSGEYDIQEFSHNDKKEGELPQDIPRQLPFFFPVFCRQIHFFCIPFFSWVIF